jgi:hypothetical protein
MDREMNPADWILDLTSVDYSSEKSEKESKERLDFLARSWRERCVIYPNCSRTNSINFISRFASVFL